MLFKDLNPFLRYAELQPLVFEGDGFRKNYDCRLFYIVNGEGVAFVNGESFTVKEGFLLYFPPATSYYFEGKLKVIVLNFDMNHTFMEKINPREPDRAISFKTEYLFDTDLPKELEAPLIYKNATFLQERMEEILFEHKRRLPFSLYKTSALIKAMLCDILTTKEESTYGPLIDQVMSYIISNCSQPLSNNDIADHFGYNAEYLSRIFKKHTGYTLHSFLLIQRISVASRMLRSTNLSIEEVAENCGFSDRIQFYTAFKKQMGVSPIAYRQSKTK